MAGATIATFFALMSHIAAGATPPEWVGVLLPWALSLPICVVLAGRVGSLWRSAVGIGASQVLFHALFALGASDSAVVSHGHHAGAIEITVGEAVSSGGSVAMVVCHALAAVVTVAAVHRGERIVLALLRAARELVARMAVIATVLAPLGVVSVRRAPRALDARAPLAHHIDVLARRGPPLSPAF